MDKINNFQKRVGKGPYSHLDYPASVGTGKDFTAAQKKNIFRRKYEKEWWKL
jgi:hypothetical protein